MAFEYGFEGISFEDSLRSLKDKLDYIMLKVQLDTIMQKRNVNAFNSNHIIYDLCRGYHVTYICRQASNVNYYDEFWHYTPYFDQYGPNWDNSYTYDWNNQYNYSDSSCFHDHQFEFVQYESKSS